MVEVGRYYRHFKGGKYKVLMLAKHSENEEEMVVYQSPETGTWVRPISMWSEVVDEKGTTRFTLLDNEGGKW